MPELPVKEVRLPELHLPIIKREQIIRSLSEIGRPTVDAPKVERSRLERLGLGARFDWRAIDWRAIDPLSLEIGRAMAGVSAVARIRRPALRPSRVTVVVGAVLVAGIAAAALLSNPAVRDRAGRTVRGVRGRVLDRTGSDTRLEVDDDLAATSDPTDPAAHDIDPGDGGLTPIADPVEASPDDVTRTTVEAASPV